MIDITQEFVQRVKDLATDVVNGIHTVIPGKIVSFDPSTGQAVVEPSMKYRKPDGTTIAYPNISGVPVMFPQSMNQAATIAYPVKSGDGCLIVSAEQALDYWMYGQETETDLKFDLTNSICIPGLFKEANAVVQEACATGAVIVDLKGTRITVKEGLVQIDARQVVINGDTTVNSNFTTKGGIVNLN